MFTCAGTFVATAVTTVPLGLVTSHVNDTVPWPGEVSVPMKVGHVINPSVETTLSETVLPDIVTPDTSTGCSAGSNFRTRQSSTSVVQVPGPAAVIGAL
jgi:hypothetical protein